MCIQFNDNTWGILRWWEDQNKNQVFKKNEETEEKTLLDVFNCFGADFIGVPQIPSDIILFLKEKTLCFYIKITILKNVFRL